MEIGQVRGGWPGHPHRWVGVAGEELAGGPATLPALTGVHFQARNELLVIALVPHLQGGF
jgi:hypothetical protein